MAKNLMTGLMDELRRNRELLTAYKSIPTGIFGASMIEKDILSGEEAIRNGDVVEMVKAYRTLKDNK